MRNSPVTIEKLPFGKIAQNETASLFILTNKNGVSAAFSDYGARWVSWKIPGKNGTADDVIIGFDSAEDYVAQTAYAGAFCGRHANRISRGEFFLCGKKHRLAVNNGPNHLHGGIKGFDRHLWASEAGERGVTFSRVSPDGEENYPANLKISLTYTLTDDGAIRLDYRAESDAPTIANLTNHAYFNLAGHANGDCHDHILRVNARHYLPLDNDNIPTGEIRPVAGGIFDFRNGTALGEHINDTALSAPRGYDHTFIVDGAPFVLRKAAEVFCPRNNRTLTVETTEPTLHLYTGNWFAECIGAIRGKGGAIYKNRAGFALEAQHAPDSVNQPAFRSNIIYPGNPYTGTTLFSISSKE